MKTKATNLTFTSSQIPLYRCHKVVRAAKIAEVERTLHTHVSDAVIRFEDGRSILVDETYMRRNNPHVGGWFVLYEDGFESFSPAEAFEDGYSPLNPAERNLHVLLPSIPVGELSDGSHSFNELYDHRFALWIALCRSHSFVGGCTDPTFGPWMSHKHSDGTGYEGWFLLGMGGVHGKQMSYHLPNSRWDECLKFAEVLTMAPEFDGHTSADVLQRLGKL